MSIVVAIRECRICDGCVAAVALGRSPITTAVPLVDGDGVGQRKDGKQLSLSHNGEDAMKSNAELTRYALERKLIA